VARSLVQLNLVTSASGYDFHRYLAHLKKELVVSGCSILLKSRRVATSEAIVKRGLDF